MMRIKTGFAVLVALALAACSGGNDGRDISDANTDFQTTLIE